MKLPIIVIADNSNAYFYDSVEKAESDMEIIDVRDGVYQVYDAEGYRLNLEVVNEVFLKKRWWHGLESCRFERPKITKLQQAEKQEGKLTNIIKLYYVSGIMTVIKKMNLENLIPLTKFLNLDIAGEVDKRYSQLINYRSESRKILKQTKKFENELLDFIKSNCDENVIISIVNEMSLDYLIKLNYMLKL